MKKIQLLFLLLLVLRYPIQAINVTFRVDMSNETASPAGVHVTGNFQSESGLPGDWNPSGTPLTDANFDQVYEVTVNIPAGGYEFKFLNGATWGTAESNLTACGIGADYNRVFVLGLADTLLPVIVFNKCPAAATDYATHWWNDAVFYEIFVRSFYDSNGDGKGDFAGLTAKLDYLNDGNPNTTTDLGITGIWLMPIMPSPSYHGYDITDYKGIEGDYGNMTGFDAFLAAAHQRGIKVIIDLVLNHTSNQHPWFAQSAANTAGPFRDWYVWSPTNPGYIGPWGQSVWSPRNGSFYYSLFYSGMPDLNWRKPELKAAMWEAVQFWLNKGVDGYRLDAVKYLVEDSIQSPALVKMENTVGTYTVLQEFTQVVKVANPNAFTIGEAWSPSTQVVPYVTENRLDACFEFDQAQAIVNAVNTGSPAALRSQLNLADQVYPKLQYGTFLSNHDQERVFSTLAGSTAKMKQAASLYLTLPGVPFLYYGEEIGMLGTGADEDKRKPMQWSNSAQAGFTTGTPWRTLNSNYSSYNVASQQASDSSLLNHYKKLIALRNQSDVLRKGYYLPATSSPSKVLSYGRILGQRAVLVVANVGSTPANALVSAVISTLPAGTYFVTDLSTGLSLPDLEINSQGGFSGYSVVALSANETRVLSISQTPTGVGSTQAKSTFTLFPNPASDFVQIALSQSVENASISLFDLEGRIVQTLSFSGNACRLAVDDLKPGHYFVKTESGKGIEVKHLIVSH